MAEETQGGGGGGLSPGGGGLRRNHNTQSIHWCLLLVSIGTTIGVYRCAYQAKGVVGVHELFYAVLLQHHYVGQVGAALTCAVLAVNHVCLPAAVLARHKQQVEHFHLWRDPAEKPLSEVLILQS